MGRETKVRIRKLHSFIVAIRTASSCEIEGLREAVVVKDEMSNMLCAGMAGARRAFVNEE